MRKLRISVSIQDFHDDGIQAGDRVFESHIDILPEELKRPLPDLMEMFIRPAAFHTLQNFNTAEPHQEEIDAAVKAILGEKV